MIHAYESSHVPIFIEEFLAAFEGKTIRYFVDCTLGAGGHAKAILEAHPEIEVFIGIDQDPSALELAKNTLASWSNKVRFVSGNYEFLSEYLSDLNIEKVDGIFIDLGVSSMQLDHAHRGFSFNKDAPLDMRMDPNQSLNAAKIVNTWSEGDLGRIFRDYSEEKHWRRIAAAIVQARRQKKIETTKELSSVLLPVVSYRPDKKIHPLTLAFQGLRIAVNDELGVIERVIPACLHSLAPGGRLGIISFHSLEDRIVKLKFQESTRQTKEERKLGLSPFILPVKKPLAPSDKEQKVNPRSRSAKLRWIERKIEE